MDIKDFKWIREPKNYLMDSKRVEIVTMPYTDLWQRTYYHFQNDNAPVLQMETDEKFFSFVVKKAKAFITKRKEKKAAQNEDVTE